ncbi:MAG: TetR/AcrR family transcriptional regulator [Actinobacteria bacterium]|nr:TetR/AcrR family transcriptional regulator [Actinomycetota bacterium]MCB9388367.1 TetR/AcrR family transcriptional regulator [Acidimicrobiia bacterium]
MGFLTVRKEPPVRLSGAERRAQLLVVARRHFAEQGFHQTSMDDIAEAAGVTKPIVYRHFASKRALFGELLDEIAGNIIAELTVATEAANGPRQRVHAGFLTYLRLVRDDPSAFRVLFGTSVRNDAEFSSLVNNVQDSIIRVIASMIEVERSDAEREVMAVAIIGVAEASCRRLILSGFPEETTIEDLADSLTEFVWFGLRGIRSGDRQRQAQALADQDLRDPLELRLP